jgi:hypothetical protein
MSAKKKIGLAFLVLVAIAIAFFWYVGSADRKQKRDEQDRHYAEILKKEAELRSLVANALSNSTTTLENFDYSDLPTRLTIKNLKTVPTSSSTLEAYALNMTDIIKPLGNEKINEVEIMLRAIDFQSDTEAQKILQTKEVYDEIISKLSKVKVPTEVARLHLKMVNSLRDMSFLSGNMVDVLRNPIAGLKSAEFFQQEKNIFYTSIVEINSYLGRKGVKFDEDKKVNIF